MWTGRSGSRRRTERPLLGGDMSLPKATLALRDVYRILFRHKRKFWIVFTIIMILVTVGLMTCPRTYMSEAKLFVKIGRESVSLDPAATVGATVAIQDSRESEIRSAIDMLESRVMREKVVQRLGAQPILRQSVNVSEPAVESWSIGQTVRGAAAHIFPADEVSEDEKAIRALERSISVEAAKKSSVVTVQCKAGSPHLAQRILQVLLETFREQHVEVNSTESYTFFQKQADALREELASASAELSQTKSSLGLSTISGQRELLETQLKSLNKDISDTGAALSSAEAKIAALRQHLPEGSAEQLNSGTSLTETALNEMRDTLYQLQIRERESLSKYQPDHPTLIAIQQQVRDVEGILSRQEFVIETANIAGMRARLSSLEARLAETQQKLELLNEHEVSISQLERRVELLRASYQTYSEKMEQARVAQALDAQYMTNLKLVQPASFIGKAVSPKITIVMLLGVVVAILGGVSVALVCEFFDHSFQTPEQVEATLNVPVLLSIPQLSRSGLLLN
jgi:polysaccharide biosynthesis protein PslE